MSLTTTEPDLASADEIETLAQRVFQELEQAGIDYCVLRGGDRLRVEAGENEIDLLIPPQQLRSLVKVLAALGFVRLRTWGHAPHHFFVTYDEPTDHWLKLDVVTQVAYGRPTHELTTELGDNCLRNRQRLGSIFIPAPEDELITLLLHCVLDKGNFPEHWRRRVQTLCDQVSDEAYVSDLLARYWSPPQTFQGLRTDIQCHQWDKLLAGRSVIEHRLANRNRISTVTSRLRDQFLRKANHVARLMRPHALAVALLAPDGAGKSTLAQGVCEHFFFPVDQIYMGLYQQRMNLNGSRLPGFGLIGKMVTQWRRYLQGYVKRACGRFVIFDRYTYDALLPARYELSPLQRLRRWLLAYACPAPDLIVLLDAPGDLLFARKGEHSAAYLEEHRQSYLRLQRQFPQMILVDAARDADQVRRAVTTHIWRGFATRLRESR